MVKLEFKQLIVLITVANFSKSSSLAPKEARPISWEKSAKFSSANTGI